MMNLNFVFKALSALRKKGHLLTKWSIGFIMAGFKNMNR